MTDNPIESVIIDGTAVGKASVRSWAKARVPQVMANAAEVNNTNLTGQLIVQLKSTGAVYHLDTSDTTTADDGVNTIISLDNLRFKKYASSGGGVQNGDSPTFAGLTVTNYGTTLFGAAAPQWWDGYLSATPMYLFVGQGAQADVNICRYNGGGNGGAAFIGAVSLAATYDVTDHGAVTSGTSLTSLIGQGDDGTGFRTIAGMFRCVVDDSVSSGVIPGRWELFTYDSSGVQKEVMTADSTQGITVPSTVTGGRKGAGSVNATTLYEAGVRVTTAASAFGTDNVVVRADGTGRGTQSSGVTIDDSNNITGAATLIIGATSIPTVAGSVTPKVFIDGAGTAASFGAFRHPSPGAGGAFCALGSSRGSVASPSAVQANDGLGSFLFYGDDGVDLDQQGAAVLAVAEGMWSSTSHPAFLSLETVVSGSTARAQAQKLDNAGQAYFPLLSTTASAGNAFLNSGSTPANQLLRSTSSLRYKTDIEPMDTSIADRLIEAAEPIWYRSKAAADSKEWSWYGLGAEDVAKIDPRLVHWGYPDDAYEEVDITEEVDVPVLDDSEAHTVEVIDGKAVARLILTKIPRVEHFDIFDESGERIMVKDKDGNQVPAVHAVPVMEKKTQVVRRERQLNPDAQKVPDGVMYERLTCHLLIVVKRERQRAADLAVRVSALEAAAKI
jgi:hypothetical protein